MLREKSVELEGLPGNIVDIDVEQADNAEASEPYEICAVASAPDTTSSRGR